MGGVKGTQESLAMGSNMAQEIRHGVFLTISVIDGLRVEILHKCGDIV